MLNLNNYSSFSFKRGMTESTREAKVKSHSESNVNTQQTGFNNHFNNFQFYYKPIVSFGKIFGIPDQHFTEIKNLLNTTSDNLITKKPSWNITTPNIWMVSAETSTFMKTGGLANVAVDLSMSYNNFYKSKTGSKMTIVQPLYQMGNLVKYDPETGLYENKTQNSSILLEPSEEKISMPTGKNGETETFEVLKGHHKDTNTDYIFIKNDKYFGDFTVKQKVIPYAQNNNGVGESERFAFFSKAVAYYAKALKERNSEDTPNIIDANDWHAAPIASIFKYLMPAKAICNNEISKETAEYFKNLPIVYTIHNLLYQGWDYPNTNKIFDMLYDNYSDVIRNEGMSSYVQTKENPVNSTTYVRDTYNASIHGLSLSDMVVAVSPNYAKETSTEKSFGYDFVKLLSQRHQNGNLTGIVNGLEPNDNLPNGKYSEGIHKHLRWFKNYYKTIPIQKIITAKQHNKANFLKYIMASRNLTFSDLNYYDELFDKKIDQIPFLTMVTRLDSQKGIEMMLEAVNKAFKESKHRGLPIPIVAVLGTDADASNPLYARKINQFKKQLPKEYADNFIFFDERNRELAFLLESSGDIFLMPSKFEPCGLSQFECMAKGTLPVATDTGGLHDTIQDHETGFLSKYLPDDPENLQNELISKYNYSKKLINAINLFHNNRKAFNTMILKAMKVDSSWEKNGSLEKYHNLFMTGSINGIKQS